MTIVFSSACMCDEFESLTGVAVAAYISQFLEFSCVDEQNLWTHYVCRRCGRAWIKVEDQAHQQPSLIRQENATNV